MVYQISCQQLCKFLKSPDPPSILSFLWSVRGSEKRSLLILSTWGLGDKGGVRRVVSQAW
jgi:hypothetical protein